jgi:hypothetical protein
MDLPTSVDIDIGSSAWALGICGVLALFILCATCVILSVTSDGKAPEVLTAFADVIRASRRRPRHEGSQAVGEGESAPQLEKAA